MSQIDFMVSFLQAGLGHLSADQRETHRQVMRDSYDSLGPDGWPENWPDLREEIEERDALQQECRR